MYFRPEIYVLVNIALKVARKWNTYAYTLSRTLALRMIIVTGHLSSIQIGLDGEDTRMSC